jgi:hypothetical protein
MVSVCCPQQAQRAVIRLLEPDGEIPALAQAKENTNVENVLVHGRTRKVFNVTAGSALLHSGCPSVIALRSDIVIDKLTRSNERFQQRCPGATPISVLPTVHSVFLILAIAKKTWLNPGSSPALLKVFLLVAAGLLLILPLPYHRCSGLQNIPLQLVACKTTPEGC